MSLEDDILQACKELISRQPKDITAYVGKATAYDSATNIVTVVVDGANTGVPVTPLDDNNIVLGRRVVILKAGGLFYMVGSLGNRVVNFPDYTGSHPSNTNPGDAWYRSDLGHAYMNVAGSATQIV